MREYLSCQTALVNILNYCILAIDKHELAGYSCLQYVIVLVHLDISLHTLYSRHDATSDWFKTFIYGKQYTPWQTKYDRVLPSVNLFFDLQ